MKYRLVVKPPAKIIFVILVLLFGCSTIVYAEPILLSAYGINISNHFNGWDDNPYVIHVHDCSDMSTEVEEYVETELGLDCLLIYGKKSNVTHMWTLIQIDNKFYEFESTRLVFKTVSKGYDVFRVQHGFYKDGTRQDKCLDYKDWEKDLGEIFL